MLYILILINFRRNTWRSNKIDKYLDLDGCYISGIYWGIKWFCLDETRMFFIFFFLRSVIVQLHNSWRVRLAKQETTLTPPGTWFSPLVCKGPWMSTVTVHQLFCILHFCHTCSLCRVELVVQVPPRGVWLRCYYAFFLVYCGWDTYYIVSVHIQCQASIYTLSLCRGHSWRVAASQAGDADSSRAPGLTSGLQGSVNVHRGALLLMPQWQCISSFVLYIVDLAVCWYCLYGYISRTHFDIEVFSSVNSIWQFVIDLITKLTFSDIDNWHWSLLPNWHFLTLIFDIDLITKLTFSDIDNWHWPHYQIDIFWHWQLTLTSISYMGYWHWPRYQIDVFWHWQLTLTLLPNWHFLILTIDIDLITKLTFSDIDNWHWPQLPNPGRLQ